MIALLAAILVAGQAPEAADEHRLPYSIDFARTQIGAWEIEASTIVEGATGVPMIASRFCEIRRSGLMLRTWGEGQLSVYVGGYNLKSDEPEVGISPSTVRRIDLDGSAWDYRWLGRWRKDDLFADIRYPPAPPRYPPGRDYIHYPVMEVLSGTIAVRRGPGAPWFSADVVANALVRARRLRIGFVEVDRDPKPDEGPLFWAEIPLDRLGDALAWCRARMYSDEARLFHAKPDR